MAFYDHFTKSETSKISPIGKKLVVSQNRYFLKLIKKHIKSDKLDLLELGPGKGFFAEECKRNGINYTAIEGNRIMAESLKEKGFDVTNGFFPPIPGEKQYNIIYMNQVFEHMKNRDEAIELLNSCKNHLAEGGLVFISCPDLFSHKQDFYQDDTHDYPTCMPRMEKLLMNYGFAVCRKKYYTFFFRGFLFARIVSFFTRFFYGLGIFHLLFRKKAYKIKVSLLSSFLIIGKKTEDSSK